MGRRPDSTPAPRGRGATINPPSRFATQQAEACDDGQAFVRRYADSPTAAFMRDIIRPIAALMPST